MRLIGMKSVFPGLGSDFLLCMDAGINKILRSPLQYPLIYKNVRRALIRRFPYEVFFVQERDRIVVLSVSHFKRNPKRWQGGI